MNAAIEPKFPEYPSLIVRAPAPARVRADADGYADTRIEAPSYGLSAVRLTERPRIHGARPRRVSA